MKTKLLALALALLVTLPTYIFFFGKHFYTFHDEVQVGNLYHYIKAIGLGQFPPRWASEMHFGYGSPFLSFNYQLPYYVGYLLSLFGLPLVTIYKLLMALSILGGVAGMFFLGLFLTNSALFSVTAAVIYAYTPYQAVVHFVRGTLGESYALALLPWLFLAAFALRKKITPTRIVLLSILFALLLISHQPASLFTLPFFVFIFVVPSVLAKKTRLATAYLASLFTGFLLSAYYVIPVMVEKGLIGSTGPFNYIDHFPFIRQLIFPSWSYSGSSPFSSDTMSFQIGVPNLAIISASALVALVLVRKKARDDLEKFIFLALLISTAAAIFLMNIRSDFLWRAIPLIQSIQFPWRLLIFTTFFAPLLFLLMTKTFKSAWLSPLAVLLAIATILLSANYFRPGLVTDRGDEYYLRRLLPAAVLLPGETVSSDYLREAEDYAPLPAGVTRPQSLPEARITTDLPAQINILDNHPYRTRAIIESKSSLKVAVHTFVYPGWEVKVNGSRVEIKPDELGAITLSLPPGRNEVLVSYVETPVRRISNIISLGAIITLGIFLIVRQKK